MKLFFFFNDTATTEIYTLSLHDALPIFASLYPGCVPTNITDPNGPSLSSFNYLRQPRSEEHTSELQSPCNLVCRLLLEKKKKSPLQHPSHRGVAVDPRATAQPAHLDLVD